MALDTQLFYLLNNLAGRSQFFDGIIVFLAGDFKYVLIVMFVAFLIFSQYPNLRKLQIIFITALSSGIAYFGVTKLVRFLYHRPRPFLDHTVNQLLTNDNWSFPSGHATFFFAVAMAVYLYNKKWGIVFFIATIFMTMSRIIAGIHYPSDIVGGAIIGIIIAYIIFYILTNKSQYDKMETTR
ncbi:phosphatase PAP2 family protein [Candidatus Kaiserbacteria bacterium]|nr:phosphatase PAP2 family protein [Candidatus Kaiserbacteria bacterium]